MLTKVKGDISELVCDDDVLEQRLKQRGDFDDPGIVNMVGFDRWLKDNAEKTKDCFCEKFITKLQIC